MGVGPRPRLDAWGAVTVAIALLVAGPLLGLPLSFIVAPGGLSEFSGYVPEALRDTAILIAGVGAGTLVLGTGLALLVSFFDFPGRPWVEWALVLPLAVPGYVFTVFALGLDLPGVRSPAGAVAVFTLVLYPYVYLLARASFLSQSRTLLEAARGLGLSRRQALARVGLPLARPAILGGVALALMEALADFGTVQYFGVDTFTTGIYRTWFALGEPVAAAQLAAALMLLVLLVLAAERWSRGLARYQHTAQSRLRPCYHLRGAWAALALAACATPVVLGFGVPVVVLAVMALGQGDALFGGLFVELAWNSLSLAAIAAALTTALAIVIGYGLRLRPSATIRVSARIAGLGYAIPGAVIAVGVLIPFARLDNALDSWLQARFGISTGLLLTGTVAGLVFAYLVRFLALALNTVEAGLGKINRNLDDAARTLGRGPGGALLRVHVPLMWGSVLTAVILVFVDVLKELPATLILRPFNFETLAVRVYRFAADERLAEASTAALAIVVVGLIPVILLSRAIARARPHGPPA